MNYNVLLFNPALLVLLYFIVKKNKKWIVNLAVLNGIFLGVYLIMMINKAHFLVVIPLVLTTLIIVSKIAYKNSKRIPVVI